MNATVDTHIVEKRFDAMTVQIEAQIDQAVAKIAEATESLVAEDGGTLTTALDAHRDGLDALLGDTFDPDSKRSVIAIFEEVIATAHEEQAETVRRLVSIDDEDGPLAKLKREIVPRLAPTATHELRKDFQELSERVAVKEAVAPVIALTTGKGFTFEDAVHDAVGRIAARHGDLAEQTGKVSGSAATQKGDEVVTLDAEDTFGFEGRFVLEAKAKKLNMRKTVEELDAALENRDALAAIAVFSSQDEAPTSRAVPAHREQGDRRVRRRGRRRLRRCGSATCGPGGSCAASSPRPAQTRWTSTASPDSSRMLAGRSTGRRAISRFHTSAKKNIDQAAEQVSSLADEVATRSTRWPRSSPLERGGLNRRPGGSVDARRAIDRPGVGPS